MIVEAEFAQGDYFGVGGEGGELFEMVGGDAGGIVGAEPYGCADLGVLAGELDCLGGIFEALAYGYHAG